MTTITNPGPTAIDSAATGAEVYVDLGDRWARRDFLVQKFKETHERVKTITNVVTGDWYVEWPDLSQTPEAPTIANLIELGINHWSSVGGALLPSIRVPTNVADGRAGQKARSRKKERRLREVWKNSNTSELAALLWGDYAGAGYAVCGAWANFSEKSLSKRSPYMQRFDPRHCHILKDENGNVTELLVARRISKTELKARWPDEWKGVFGKSRDEDIEEWYWYEKDRFFYAIVDVNKDHRGKKQNTMVLVDETNDLGFVPVWEAVRPTFDGQRRGVFDQTIHILRTMHRLMMMTIYSSEEHAFPATLEYDVVNPGDFGPGASMHGRSPESKFERISPTSHFDVKDLIARLADQAQQGATLPQQLSGEPGASIVSARGINASMGALDARLALAHRQFEVLFGKVSGFLLAVEETYCDGLKQILGDYRDSGKQAEEFNPGEDIAGVWDARCTYGIGAGSDPQNTEVRITMHHREGLLSAETARENLPYLEDPDGEKVKVLREEAQKAVMAGVFTMAAEGGQVEPAAALLKELTKDDADADEAIANLIEFVMNPPQQQEGAGGAPGGAGAALEAESLARGGIPGNASDLPQQSAVLPPLGQLMGQDSRQAT